MKLAVFYILFFTAAFCRAQAVFTEARKNMNSTTPERSLAVMDSCVLKNYQPDSALFYGALLSLKLNRVKEARKRSGTLLRSYPGFRGRHYLNGLIFFTDQNYGRCISEFNLAAKEEPHNLRIIYNRALAFGMLEEYLSAIEDLTACIDLDSGYVLAYYSRAYWYEYTGNYPESAKDYESVIRLDPKNYDAYHGLAYVYQNLHETQKACQVINKAIKEGSQIAEELKEIFCKE